MADELPHGPVLSSFGLHGHLTDTGDEVVMVVGVDEEHVLEISDLPKSSREIKQVLEGLILEAFTAAAPEFAHYVATQVPAGEDPPDFVLRSATREIALEVTQLTMENVRRDYAQVRQLSQAISTQIENDSALLPHLRGRRVCVGFGSIPKRSAIPNTAAAVRTAVDDNVGFVGEGIDFANGMPETLGTRGFVTGLPPDIACHIELGPTPDSIAVRVTLMGHSLLVSEIEQALHELIEKKDRPENEMLLISVGAPDADGFVCAADSYLFGALRDYELGASVTPTHLKAIYLHHWSTFEVRRLFAASDWVRQQ